MSHSFACLFFLLNVIKPQQQATYGKNDSLGLVVRRVTSHRDGKADLRAWVTGHRASEIPATFRTECLSQLNF